MDGSRVQPGDDRQRHRAAVDRKLVAAVFGMDAESVMIYLADHLDPDRETALPRSRA
jgi:hypothetical protein